MKSVVVALHCLQRTVRADSALRVRGEPNRMTGAYSTFSGYLYLHVGEHKLLNAYKLFLRAKSLGEKLFQNVD